MTVPFISELATYPGLADRCLAELPGREHGQVGVETAKSASRPGRIEFTLRTYVHLMPDAADRMRSVAGRALSPEADGPGRARE